MLERFALSSVNLCAERLDFDNGEIAIHLAWNMEQEIRLRVIENSSPDNRLPTFVNLARK